MGIMEWVEPLRPSQPLTRFAKYFHFPYSKYVCNAQSPLKRKKTFTEKIAKLAKRNKPQPEKPELMGSSGIVGVGDLKVKMPDTL